ncbi:aspartate aminotransferase family protein [Mesorhizobium sp. ZMM04-5]|uniref:Aspartate aminotransferase family protein n=1 Tax=Mesorhizobium marinum TaxID=3228790 RepID=A0ABV3R3D6_9HYPH
MQSLNVSNEELSRLGQEALQQALSYWATLDERPSYPATTGEETERLFSRPWSEQGIGRAVFDDFAAIADRGRPSTGRFFGYVVGSGEPVGALGDLLASALNQNTTSWRSAPAAATVEKAVTGWLADAVGCPGFRGSLCGGGSAANLMALAMARESRLPANETGARPGIVYASEEIHMSIPKAIALLGIGRDNLRLIPVDGDHRIRVHALDAAISADRAARRAPMAIVASAGTVKIGAVDPLDELADLAEREDLWLHVDGAYGGLAALAAPEKFRGLDRVDSLSLDTHKWLYQPLDCGCVLYRDREVARKTFTHSGDYVRILTDDPVESFAFFEESMELSRRFRGLKLWMSLQYHGRAAFRDAVRRDLEHAQLLAELVTARPELELLAPVSLSAVCFRHRSKDNAALLKRLVARGRVYLSNATIGDQFALRVCFVNHRTTHADVRLIVEEVIAAADELDP